VNPGFINFTSWGGWDCGRCIKGELVARYVRIGKLGARLWGGLK
jgi:hypothetical protein